MADAVLRSGSPTFADYTPVGAIVAGDVIVVGDLPVIAHTAIAAAALGAVSVGGGIYDMVADAAITAGSRVWWDATSKVSETPAGMQFGYIAPGSSSAVDGDTVQVVHAPESLAI
jgi:predicted RecA/RadA family phage recombinase